MTTSHLTHRQTPLQRGTMSALLPTLSPTVNGKAGGLRVLADMTQVAKSLLERQGWPSTR